MEEGESNSHELCMEKGEGERGREGEENGEKGGEGVEQSREQWRI